MLLCFGEKLRYLRQQNNVTQIDLAARLGLVAQGQISRLENGRRQPSLTVVIGIAELFSVTTDYLLRDDVPIDIHSVYQTGDRIIQAEPIRLFGIKLRQLRTYRGLTQSDLAQHLAPYTQAHVSQLERGFSEPSIELTLDVAGLFQVTTDYLIRDIIPVEEESFPSQETESAEE